MRLSIKLLSLFLLVFVVGAWTLTSNKEDDAFDTLVWADEFNTSEIDKSKWSHDLGDGCPNVCGWGNDELEYYTSREKNARIENGRLILELHKEAYESKNHTSARIHTKGKGDWRYGRFEIKAKMPSGKGTWPAIWMMPSDNTNGTWPRAGEIDIIEKVGYSPDSIISATHTQAYNHTKNTHKSVWHLLPDNDEAFHIYVLEWRNDHYKVLVDGAEIYRFSKDEDPTIEEWPFDTEFHLILNLAYGGNWGGMHGIDETALPTRLEVDYVRVYQ